MPALIFYSLWSLETEDLNAKVPLHYYLLIGEHTGNMHEHDDVNM